VLVHHADPGLDGVGRGAEAHRPTVDGDGALVGLLHPVEDLHQGGLAGAVLPAQRVHLAAAHAQVDVAVGDDPGEALRDPGELHGAVGLGPGVGSGHRATLSHGCGSGGRGHVDPDPPITDCCYGVVSTVMLPEMIAAL
jgi:hypothetical protein